MKNPRSAARLNQPVCSLEGLCAWFQRMPGDFAVVIHGQRDCGNVVVQSMDLPGCQRFFCTQLDESSAVAGISGRCLEDCLEAICTSLRPRRVFLLGTCTSALIGEDLDPVAARVAARTSIPITALPVTSMRFVGQGEIADRFAMLVTQICPVVSGNDHLINLIGFDPGTELRERLQDRGVHVNQLLGLGSSLDNWHQVAAAGTNVVLDRELFPGFLEEAHLRFGQRDLVVPYPIGISATTSFFKTILEALCVPTEARDGTDPALDEARGAIAAARPHIAGQRLGYNLGSLKNMDPQRLALEGLIDLPFFEELGLKIVVLVQGDDRPQRRAAMDQVLEQLGCQAEVAYFADTVSFGQLCQEQRCDLVYAADFLMDQVKPHGIGFVTLGSIAPGFGGVPGGVETVLNAIGQRNRSRT